MGAVEADTDVGILLFFTHLRMRCGDVLEIGGFLNKFASILRWTMLTNKLVIICVILFNVIIHRILFGTHFLAMGALELTVFGANIGDSGHDEGKKETRKKGRRGGRMWEMQNCRKGHRGDV